MHNPDFWDQFMRDVIARLNPKRKYGLLLQPRSSTASITLGTSVVTDASATQDWFENHFNPILQSMEDDYDDSFDLDTRIKIRDLGTLETAQPRPSPTKTSSKDILQAIHSSNQTLLESHKSQTIALLESQQAQTKALLDGIKSSSFSWEPVVTVGTTLIDRVLDRLLPPLPTSSIPEPSRPSPAAQAPREVQDNRDLVNQLLTAVNQQAASVDRLSQGFNQLSATVNTLAQSQASTQATVDTLASTVNQLSQGFNTLTQLVAGQSKPKGSSNGSTPPAAPAAPSASSPLTGNSNQMVDDIRNSNVPSSRKLHTQAVIEAGKPYLEEVKVDLIVTADLEALITKDGRNEVYMAAWYNGSNFKVFDITNYGNNSNSMLQGFWLSLLNEAQGSVVFFHNWAGYDAILSMEALISLHTLGYYFEPILQKGQVLSLTVKKDKRIILTIKDSIRLLPGSLAKLAKDFRVETQKDHFPHYFNPLELHNTLDWSGPLPSYTYFEPKTREKY